MRAASLLVQLAVWIVVFVVRVVRVVRVVKLIPPRWAGFVTIVVALAGFGAWGMGVIERYWEPFAIDLVNAGPQGPDVRVEVSRGTSFDLGDLGEVTVRPLDDGVGESEADRVLFRGSLDDTERVTVRSGTIDFGGRLEALAIRIERADRHDPWTLARRSPSAARGSYRGEIELRFERGQIHVTNVVTLEQYLRGVVPAEMPALYPEAALRAQAVASRTYVLHAIEDSARRERPAVFRADTGFQVYRGVAAEHERAARAIAATRGEVMTFDGELFRAYFHSTCGGQTSSAERIFGERDVPPLRGAVCGGCDGSKFSRWQTTIDRRVVQAALARCLSSSERAKLGRIDDVLVEKRAADGRAETIRVAHSRGDARVEAGRFRLAVAAVKSGSVRSTAFEIERVAAGSWVLRGRGFGHGAGFCQVGSRGLAREGMSYRDILSRYYPRSETSLAY